MALEFTTISPLVENYSAGVLAASFIMLLIGPMHYKIFISLFVMSNAFDLLPRTVYNIKFSDFGIAFFAMSFGISKLTADRKSRQRPQTLPFMRMYIVFYAVMLLSFAWSIFIYDYSFTTIVQASRGMLIGYALTFGLLYIYREHDDTAIKLQKLVYFSLQILLALYAIQYVTKIKIFFGYNIEESGAIRSIPNYYPLAFIYFYGIITTYFSGGKLHLHHKLYIVSALLFIAGMLTRGIYLTTIAISLWQLCALNIHKSIKLTRFVAVAYGGTILVAIYLMLSSGESVVFNKIENAFTTFSEAQKLNKNNLQRNTFSLRLMLLQERMRMVLDKNPLIGYGFIHEDIAQRTLNYSVGTYNKLAVRELTFSSQDIAWANILIYTGYAGLVAFIIFVASLARSFLSNINPTTQTKLSVDSNYGTIAGLYFSLLASIMLMTNGAGWTHDVQLYSFMLSSYAHFASHCTSLPMERSTNGAT